MLQAGGYTERVRWSAGELRLVGSRGRGVPLGAEPAWADLFRALVRCRSRRTRHDPRWLRRLSRQLPGPAPDLPAADGFAAVVRTDPVLRMHCAVLAARAEHAEPSPQHPEHPGGTIAAGSRALVEPGPDGAPALLKLLVDNRFEHREHEFGFFLERFVRPAVRAFRIALEQHRAVLFAGEDARPAFELSPELAVTGRVVATGVVADAHPVAVARGARSLRGALDELGAAFDRIGYRPFAAESARAGIERVLTEEFRYLQPRTARLLGSVAQLRPFAHTVESEQDELLRHVLHQVQERTRKRRWDRSLPQPAVVIDLDLCGIVPLRRTVEATRAIAGPRPGAPEGIPELAGPDSLPVLPTCAEATWQRFVELSGLGAQYPAVDWPAVHTEFSRALARPRELLRTDVVNAGLARFAWDVRDAGGQVVFCTGRDEQLREHTEAVLAAAGVPTAPLLCMPDGKAEALPELRELDVIAVFGDQREGRIALGEAFPSALTIRVQVPGLVAEREQPHVQRAIATFETTPRAPAPGPRLSHTHSLEELQIGELRANRSAQDWAVRLDHAESLEVVRSVRADADRAADRLASSARSTFALDEPGTQEQRVERTLRALHHVLTRKQFRKGARANYQVADLRRDAEPFVRGDQPIDVVLLGFPVKQHLNGLKASGPLPDLAELGSLLRLREMHRAASAVHPPGLRFRILTDGRHFRPRPASITGAYVRKLREYAELAGIAEACAIEEVDAAAARRIGGDLTAERAVRAARYRRLLTEALRGLDITDDPLRTLDSAHARASEVDDSVAPALVLFREMLMSLVYSVPLPVPSGMRRGTWARLVYSDVYDLAGSAVPPAVRQARADVLRRAWHIVIRYLATLRVDEELGYEEMFPNRIRLTVSAARRGRCGFTYLGGSGLLPWQGTGAVDARGTVGADFAVSLQDQGFVPVYSALLGPRQPWFAVPAGCTVPGRGEVRLDPELVARARLRRK